MKIDGVYWVGSLMRVGGLGCTGVVGFKLGLGWERIIKTKDVFKKPYRNLILYFSILVILLILQNFIHYTIYIDYIHSALCISNLPIVPHCIFLSNSCPLFIVINNSLSQISACSSSSLSLGWRIR